MNKPVVERAGEPIPLLDLSAQHAALSQELRAAIDRVVESSHFILGPEVARFEEEVAEYIGAEHAVGVSSGTDALLASFMALGIGPGDEVVTTPYTFFATAGCVVRLGARPVFVDIEPATYNLDMSRVERVMSSRTRAVVPVHLFGQAADMERLLPLCRERGIPVVEDAAQAIGACSREHRVGTAGELACFSFFPSKNLGAFGDAGLITTSDDALAERLRMLRAHGSRVKYDHPIVGGNFRLDALQAAVLRVKLPHLDRWAHGRVENAAAYDALFAAAGFPAELLSTPQRVQPGHIYNQYVIRTRERDALREHLGRRGIGCAVYYPRPLHLQPCFADLGYREGDFPEAEAAARETLALPVFPELGADRRRRVADAVIEFLSTRA